ncbi:Uncharacterized exported protein YjcN [Bacillus velezensis]|nr:Uncharacterized exported protein YjcN [Bacillus velezensis]
MKKKIYLLLTLSAALALLLTALPALSPVVFTSASEKGAIRHDIYKKGYIRIKATLRFFKKKKAAERPGTFIM